jgi:SAM-dependent methyltransferase
VRCCGPPGVEIFDERQARRDLARYRRQGLDRAAKRLVEAVAGTAGDVLEIGGGVGAIEIELLRRGVTRAVNVELSPAYESYARELLDATGLSPQVERHVGDLVERPDLAESADAVVMHRVVCCYPDMPALVGVAADKARRLLALTYPRDAWWTRLGARAVNLAMRLARKEYRSYIHAPDGIRATAAAHGLRPTLERPGVLWQLAAFERDA